MADLAFEQTVSTIVGMKDEIVRALGETFVMIGLSTTIAVIFSTLLGVLLFVTSGCQLHYNKPVNFLLDNLVNLMRAFPLVILTIATIPATRATIGNTISPVAVSLVLNVSGLLYFVRLVEQNLREAPKGVIETATAMGASPLVITRKVLSNEAHAGVISSITALAIGLLSYSATVGMIGGGGLDDLAIRYGYYRYRAEVTIFIVALLVLFVILIQSTGNALAQKLGKRWKLNTKIPSEKYV